LLDLADFRESFRLEDVAPLRLPHHDQVVGMLPRQPLPVPLLVLPALPLLALPVFALPLLALPLLPLPLLALPLLALPLLALPRLPRLVRFRPVVVRAIAVPLLMREVEPPPLVPVTVVFLGGRVPRERLSRQQIVLRLALGDERPAAGPPLVLRHDLEIAHDCGHASVSDGAQDTPHDLQGEGGGEGGRERG